MVNPPRRRRGATLSILAALMLAVWVVMVFIARSLASNDSTSGYAAFVGFLVICFTAVTYVLFMMAVDSDRA